MYSKLIAGLQPTSVEDRTAVRDASALAIGGMGFACEFVITVSPEQRVMRRVSSVAVALVQIRESKRKQRFRCLQPIVTHESASFEFEPPRLFRRRS